MAIELQSYSSENHSERTVAYLIFDSDPTFNTLVYGTQAVAMIEGMLRLWILVRC